MLLGQKIKTARLAARLTQDALGRKVGIGQDAISIIEAGHVDPRLKTLRRIAKALGIEPGALL